MKLSSQSFNDGERIPEEFLFGKIDPAHHVTLSTNRNPQLSWDNVPVGTRSFAIVCHDYDVPSSGELRAGDRVRIENGQISRL